MMDIDRIARQIVDADPSTDLEARIRARLDAEPPPTRRGAWVRWAMVGGLVGGAAVAALLVGSGTSVEVGTPVEVGTSVEAGTPVGVRESRGAEAVTSVGVQASRGPEVKVAVLSAEELAWMERRIPALEPVDELRVDFLTYDAIQPEGLSIAPLIMTALPTDGVEFARRDNR